LKEVTPSHPVERGVIEPLPEENTMETETRMATPKQLAYLQRLSTDSGMTVAKPLMELTVTEASQLIEELVERVSNGPGGRQNC
jgi:hypothetical protein